MEDEDENNLGSVEHSGWRDTEEDDDEDIGGKGEKDDVEESNGKHVKGENSGKIAEINGEEVLEIKDQDEKTKSSNEESEKSKPDSVDIHTEL